MTKRATNIEQLEKISTEALPPGSKPWQAQPGESVLDYYRFKFYLDLGPARSFASVAGECEMPVSAISKLAKANKWAERSLAYDAHIIDMEFQGRDLAVVADATEWARRRDSIRERAYTASLRLIAKAEEMLEHPLIETIVDSVEEWVDGVPVAINRVTKIPTKWAMRDAAVMLNTADQLSRLAAEMPTSYQKVSVEEKKVNLTVTMVVGLISKGLTPDQVRERLIAVEVAEDEIDQALDIVLKPLTENEE